MAVKQYPFFVKSTVVLFGLTLLAYALLNLKDIFSPLAFALIIAILLNPLVNKLKKNRLPTVVSIILSMLLGVLVLGGILYFLSSQIANFSETYPVLKEKFHTLQGQLQHWVQQEFGIAINKQLKMVNDGIDGSKALVGTALGSAFGTLGLILLVPVYIFLLLLYKPLMLNFLYDVFADEHSKKVQEVLNQTKLAIQSYMVGLLLEAACVAILNSTALLILDVKYAILLGVLGALLNMLPYIGGIIAIALPVLMATVTKDGFSTQLGIIAAYAVIQFIDNNILVPRIVSSKVQINALFSIIVVLLGGALWGVAGMFLSIPFVAIIKIVFDRIDELKPWGKLLGDEIPTNVRRISFRRKKSSVSEKIVEDTN
ncbi:AI-2E family transporter [Pedobacter sp. HMF7647]|uniref:AI-2E family transporter n=1 Tax=Hufsiella arboris TaxID=2695275 RepID=A0A7K1Y9V6_9SPHI|nr:AI-2E family transporter [Hufsiella arboris]MXV51121.1 AI-2E family transporter [Hufsiella arboris]